MSDTPLALMYNGDFAVSIFFVLSGYVISGALRRSPRPIIESVVLRYIRLALPAFASCVFAWLLLQLNSGSLVAAKKIDASQWLTYAFDDTSVPFSSPVVDGLFGIFASGGTLLNNALWTMKLELIGSCMLYLIYSKYLVSRRVVALILIVPLSFGLHRPEYGAFAIGALIQEARAVDRIGPFALPMLICGLLVGSTMPGIADRVPALKMLAHLPDDLKVGQPHKIWHIVAAGAVIYAVIGLPKVARWCARAPFRFLGRISFGLYLTHVPMIYYLFSNLYVGLPVSPDIRLIVMLSVYAPSIIAAGYVMTVLVDEPTLKLIKVLRSIRQQPRDAVPAP